MTDREDGLYDGGVIDPNGVDEADDNIVQPFQLLGTNLRGRVVRLGPELDEIITAHDYPTPISHLVAETLTLTLLLSAMLKYDGIFTLQAQGDGPLSRLVGDVTSGGEMRACATFDPERLQHAREQLGALKSEEGNQNHLAQYLGKGYIAFTVDQAGGQDRYQGIVELKGSSLTDCVQHYFKQSEQIATGIKMAVGLRGGRWRAGALMVQHMPEEGGFAGIWAGSKRLGNLDEDGWRRNMILLGSCTEDELLDPDLHSHVLLHRLFHEEGVRVYEPHHVHKSCRCTRERVENIIKMMPDDDIEYFVEQGKAEITCEFCSRAYVFSAQEVKALCGDPPQRG